MDEGDVQAASMPHNGAGNGTREHTDDSTTAGPTEVSSRLSHLGQMIPPLEIAELWVFPPLEDVEHSAEFFLFTRFLDGEARRLYSARLPPANGTPARQVVVEHGSVPADRVPRLVDRLQRRLGRDHSPRHVIVDGRVRIWDELVAGETPPD